jgi:neutral ceramidase
MMHRHDSRVSRRRFLATAAASAAGPALLTARPADGKGQDGQPPATFRAGAAARKITPELGVDLEGYFMKLGPITAVHDDLHARALVLDDGTQRVAIVVCDMCIIPGDVFDRAKLLVHQQTGLPTDRMLMSSTHTHAAPRVGVATGKKDLEYADFLAHQIAEAVGAATKNLAPAKIGWGSGQKPEYTYNRRWWMKPGTIPPTPFGKTDDRVQFNPPRGSKNLVKPAGPVDPEVSVLSVRHADGRPLALMANYSIHYVGGYVKGHISADYFGVFSKRIGELLEADTAFVGMMSNGTSGNIGAGTDFRKPGVKVPPWSRMDELGAALADEALRVAGKIEHRDVAPIAMREKDIELAIRRPDDKRLQWARQILGDKKTKHRHRWTPIYANEALLLAEYPATVPVKLQALRIGDLAIGAIPCEVFAEIGLALKEASPLEHTFIVELANQYHGYLPTPEQHELGAYETWDARSSCLEVDAATKIRDTVSELLESVAGA